MPTSPWSVKGVDPEAREAAKIAARRAGLTVGQWLSHTIRNAATEQLRNGGRGPTQPESGGGQAPPGYSAQPPAPTMQAIFESIQKLTSRIDDSEARTAAALEPLADQVDQLSKRIEEVRERDGINTAPVERAVIRLTERLQKIEQDAKSGTRRSSSRWGLFGFSR